MIILAGANFATRLAASGARYMTALKALMGEDPRQGTTSVVPNASLLELTGPALAGHRIHTQGEVIREGACYNIFLTSTTGCDQLNHRAIS